jgi:hypothetical protein
MCELNHNSNPGSLKKPLYLSGVRRDPLDPWQCKSSRRINDLTHIVACTRYYMIQRKKSGGCRYHATFYSFPEVKKFFVCAPSDPSVTDISVWAWYEWFAPLHRNFKCRPATRNPFLSILFFRLFFASSTHCTFISSIDISIALRTTTMGDERRWANGQTLLLSILACHLLHFLTSFRHRILYDDNDDDNDDDDVNDDLTTALYRPIRLF